MTKIKQQKLSWTFLGLFFIFLSTLLILFSSGGLDSEDGWLYSSVARNIYYHHQVAAAPDEYPNLNVHMNTTKGKDGVWRAPGSFGYSLSLIPAIALSDFVHRIKGATPPVHFPLQNDWSFHLFASFTNAFWGAMLGLFIFLMAYELHFSIKTAVIISLTTLLTTNLLVLTKFSFAHMMFIACLLASTYFIKRSNRSHQYFFLTCAIISYLLVAISYNITYYLPIIPLLVYFLLLIKPSERLKFILIFLVTGILITFVFPIQVFNLSMSLHISPKVLFEGVWGFLFSPGKSIFLYSPPLILIPLFWHKIKKTTFPELIMLAILTFAYLYFVGAAAITDHGLPAPIWHGGMVWGPRYVAPLIPFAMLLTFQIINSLNSIQKKLIVIPLFILGFWIQLVGASMEYLLQYRDIPYSIFIGRAEFTVYDYASFIPRYSPLIALSKGFISNVRSFPSTIARGSYTVRFFDGFDIPLYTPTGPIRGFRQDGYIMLTNRSSQPLAINLLLYNAPDNLISSASAEITFSIDEKTHSKVKLLAQKEDWIRLSVSTEGKKSVTLGLNAIYSESLKVPHVLYIKEMTINGTKVNLASLDYPDVSTLGSLNPKMPYRYFGNKMNDNWKLWDQRGLINALTLDYWWIKNLYYWDHPQNAIWVLFVGNLTVCILSGVVVMRKLK